MYMKAAIARVVSYDSNDLYYRQNRTEVHLSYRFSRSEVAEELFPYNHNRR